MDRNPCCCISLRKGVLIIAIIDIVIGALGAGLGIFAIFSTLVVPSHQNENPPTITDQSTDHQTPDTAIKTSGGVSTGTTSKHSQGFVGVLLALFVVYCIFQIAFGGVLILGLVKERILLLKAWLGFRCSGALFTLGTLVAFGVLGSSATIQPGVVDLFSLIFSIYCLYVVYTLCHQLKVETTKNIKPFNHSTGAGGGGNDRV